MAYTDAYTDPYTVAYTDAYTDPYIEAYNVAYTDAYTDPYTEAYIDETKPARITACIPKRRIFIPRYISSVCPCHVVVLACTSFSPSNPFACHLVSN